MPARVRLRFAMLVAAALLAACAPRPLVSLRPAPSDHAWWLRTAFEPRGDALRGVPVRRVRADWCAIDELGPRHFAGLDPHAVASSARYSVAGPDIDGRATVATLAVFRACSGDTGTALLLLDASRAAAPLAVEVVASPAHYAMLDRGPSGELHVVFCQDCDDSIAFVWNGTPGRLVELPAPADLP